MAERRMFAKTIIDSDAFLDMPMSARLLYYDLAMRADDDGFVNSPKKIMRMVGATQDDMSILAIRKFIIPFDNGVVVIKHWYIHNYIRKDTYNETSYKEQKSLLEFDENKSYRLRSETDSLLTVDEPSTQVSLGKDRSGKERLGKVNTTDEENPKREYDFDKHQNTQNYEHLKETVEDEFINYITVHVELDECVTTWMKYKDEKKPKSQNHYGETGLLNFLNKIYSMSIEHGVSQVVDTIEKTMSNNYQGIVWDWLTKNKPKQQQDFFEQMRNA